MSGQETFNTLLDGLLPYTEDNIRIQFEKIGTNFILTRVYKIEDIFMPLFSKYISELAFCTDVSRRKLVIKDEQGQPVKQLGEQVVFDCLEKCKDQINMFLQMINAQIEQLYIDKLISEQQYKKYRKEYTILDSHLRIRTSADLLYIKKMSNSLSRACKQLNMR